MKKHYSYLLLFLLTFSLSGITKAQDFHAVIEPAKIIKTDPKLITIAGYLVVPENRKKPQGNKIKIPFTFVRRPDQSATKNISLYTTGGPGYSTTANIDSISYGSGFLKFGGFVAFDQRGTKRALPSLDCGEVENAIRQSYRENKNLDSLVKLATLQCRKELVEKGIDLSSYTTLESAEDINDLRLALHIDSLNLVGISYSGGLMLTVAKVHPEAVKTLILNSPLPSFVSYEEKGLYNINEALEQVFENCRLDSPQTYSTLKAQFQKYFSTLGNSKKFSFNYLEKGTADSILIHYGKSELLDVIVNKLNTNDVKNLPRLIKQLIEGKHQPYLNELMNSYFAGNPSLSLGMRYSIYCSEQIAHSSKKKQDIEEKKLPWLMGYRFNNVDQSLCDCWNIKPEPKSIKTPTISNVPALISAGDIDPWTRPYYNKLIKKTMPNAQLFIMHNRGHAAGFNIDGTDYLQLFMENPNKKLISKSDKLMVE